MAPALFQIKRHGDERGWFSETYSARALAAQGITTQFVQDNHSYSAAANTIRGLHFQAPPSAQAKLVRCLRGEIWDVIVDLRQGSPTYGKWEGVLLSESTGLQLFVPEGYGHGFQTLVPDCEIVYKVSAPYDPATDGGVAWDDADIGVAWKPLAEAPTLSQKDTAMPKLTDWQSPFGYDGMPFDGIRPVDAA